VLCFVCVWCVFIVCSVSFIVSVVLCAVFCLSVVCYFVLSVLFVCCLIIVPLPPGKTYLQFKKNNNINNTSVSFNLGTSGHNFL
jgi:uncharacterized protein YqhQ